MKLFNQWSVAAGALLLLSPMSNAGTLTITGGSTTAPNTWATESGQSIPTGTAGFVGGTLVNSGNGLVFTYGGGGLLAGDTGHGDSIFINEFWVGSSEAAAEAAGQVFCTHAEASCGGVATAVGAQFSLNSVVGNVPFGFTFGTNNANVLLNGQTNAAIGAYLAQIGLGTTPNAAAGLVAYLGLSDQPYPGDADFQDQVVRVASTPEPGTMLLLGAGLVAVATVVRRKKA